MKKLFENKTIYTKDVHIEFLKFHRKKYQVSYIAYTAFWSFIFFLCIVLAFGSNLKKQGVLITIVLILFILYRIYRPKLILKRDFEGENSANNSIQHIFSFYDNQFKVENDKGTFTYRYFSINRVLETTKYFYLYTTKEDAFLISKSKFSIGTPQEFAKFMKQKKPLNYKVCDNLEKEKE